MCRAIYLVAQPFGEINFSFLCIHSMKDNYELMIDGIYVRFALLDNLLGLGNLSRLSFQEILLTSD